MTLLKGFGGKIRKKVNSCAKSSKQAYKCDRCKSHALVRVTSGYWTCKKCELKVTGNAYSP